MDQEKATATLAADINFKTNNQRLAFALALAGCEFASQAEGGPAQNLYTLGWLRDRRLGKGMPIEDAVRSCAQHRIAGNVTYIFKRTEELERAIATWDECVKECSLAEYEKRQPSLPRISAETVMRVLHVYFNSLEKLKEVAFINIPLCGDVVTSKTIEKDGKHITEGSGKIWQLGSTKVKEKLNIK